MNAVKTMKRALGLATCALAIAGLAALVPMAAHEAMAATDEAGKESLIAAPLPAGSLQTSPYRLLVKGGVPVYGGTVLSTAGDVALVGYSDKASRDAAAASVQGAVEFAVPDTAFTAASEESAAAADALIDDAGALARTEAPARDYDVALIDTWVSIDGIDRISVLGSDATHSTAHGDAMADCILAEHPQASILAIEALDGSGTGSVATVYAAMIAAIEADAKVIALPLSAQAIDGNDAIADAVAQAQDAGIIVVGAAGNDGSDARWFVPGCIEDALVVGACDADGVRLAGSNFGSSVDIYAVAKSTSEAAAHAAGWIAAYSDFANLEDDLSQAVADGTFFRDDADASEAEGPDKEAGDGAFRGQTTFWVTTASGSTDVYTGTWKEGTGTYAGRWWVEYSDGSFPKNCWIYDVSKGKYCYMNSRGYAYVDTLAVLPYSNATVDKDRMFVFGFDSQCYAVTGSATFDGTKYGFSRKYTTNAEAKKHPNGTLYTGAQGDSKGYWGPINEAGVYGLSTSYGLSLAMYAKLTFDPTEGTGGGAVYRYSDVALTKVPNATRTGYTFKGWYTAKSGGTKVTTSTKCPRTAATYYAQWTPNTYTIAYAGMSGATHGSSHPTSGTYDTTLTVNNPTRTGYTFAGWKVSGMDSTSHVYGSSTTTNTSISSTKATTFKNLRATSGTVTFTAQWEPIVYAVSLDPQGATSAGSTAVYEKYGTGIYKESGCTSEITTTANPITKPARAYTVTYDYNGSGAKPTTATATYTFGGYYTAANGGGTQRINANGTLATFPATAYTASATLYAKWTGGSVVLPTPTRSGYTFGKWNTKADGSGTSYAGGASFTPSANTTLYAQWTPANISFTVPSEINLTVNADGTLNTPTDGMYLDNESDFAIEVSALHVTPSKGWDLVAPGEEAGRTDAAALQLGPSGHEVNACDFTSKQTLESTAGWKMERNGASDKADQLQFGMMGSISSVDDDLIEKTQIASIHWYVQRAS